MPTATTTITPSFINQPKAGKKMANVKLKDESIMLGLPSVINQMKAGGTYTVEYEEATPNFNYRTIKKVISTDSPAPASGGGGKYGATDDATAERIFVCGALNAFIAAGKIEANAGAVTQAVLALRRAWADTFGKKATPAPITDPGARSREQKDEDLSDEIPF